MEESRIFFRGNPWKEGHKIKEFQWIARLEPDQGIFMDFHLKSDDYYAEKDFEIDDDEEFTSDWEAHVAWSNYHSCTMSSNNWHLGGILWATAQQATDFNLQGKSLYADPLPIDLEKGDYEDLAFHIYLLGHDTCADHRIHFLRKKDDGSFDIKWTGKIALTYVGNTNFEHEFEAKIFSAKFEGIEVPKEMSNADVEKYMKAYLSNPGDFKFDRKKNRILPRC